MILKTQKMALIKSPFSQKKLLHYYKFIALFIFPIIGVFVSLILIFKNQDFRQRASEVSPYSQFLTEENCEGKGKWIEPTCYLYGETVDEKYIVMPPGSYGNYSYVTLQPIEKAQQYLAQIESNSNLSSEQPQNQSIESNNSAILQNCKPPFVVIGDKCIPDQKSAEWNSNWINRLGCGPMQTLYYALQKNPALNEQQFLEQYYAPYITGQKNIRSNNYENIEVLENLGYTVEPYTKSVIAHGADESKEGNSFFIKGVFSNGIDHYFSVSEIEIDSRGRVSLEVVDSYFGIEKCIATGASTLECYDSSEKLVTSLDFTEPETSVFLVIGG